MIFLKNQPEFRPYFVSIRPAATAFGRQVHDVAGTFMVTDVPIGKYTVKAVYPGGTLLLDNRHDDEDPAVSKTVIFGKYGSLWGNGLQY